MASARGGRWPPADVGRAAGGAMARHAGRRAGAGRQAGRQASPRGTARACAPADGGRAVARWVVDATGWVARQAAPYSALNDWHGLFCCRPRFPRLRAVLAVARTARACCARACCCALARRAGARPTTPLARAAHRSSAADDDGMCGRRRSLTSPARAPGGGGGGGGGSRERARVQGGCKAGRGAARSLGSYRWFMENSDIVCAAAAPLGAR